MGEMLEKGLFNYKIYVASRLASIEPALWY